MATAYAAVLKSTPNLNMSMLFKMSWNKRKYIIKPVTYQHKHTCPIDEKMHSIQFLEKSLSRGKNTLYGFWDPSTTFCPLCCSMSSKSSEYNFVLLLQHFNNQLILNGIWLIYLKTSLVLNPTCCKFLTYSK